MMLEHKIIRTPITETKKLKSGDYVEITGTVYVARDAAHKRMMEALDRGENLPINIEDSTIYYMGQKAMIGKGKRSQEVIDSEGNDLYQIAPNEFCAL